MDNLDGMMVSWDSDIADYEDDDWESVKHKVKNLNLEQINADMMLDMSNMRKTEWNNDMVTHEEIQIDARLPTGNDPTTSAMNLKN